MPDLADVVVVGGGVLGVALAYELARHNERVVLLEAKTLASGTTGSSFAWINATAKFEVETYHRLNAEGVARYRELAGEHGAEALGLHEGGALLWVEGADAAGHERLRARAARLQEWGYPVVMLDRAEMQALEPGVVFGREDGAEGLFAPAEGWLDTPRLARFLVEAARRHKAEIRLDCAATGFTRSRIPAGISTVETPQGRISTRLLVLAAGEQTPALVALVTGDPADTRWAPVERSPGLLVETPPVPETCRIDRVLFPPDSGGLHVRPTSAGGLLLGADDTDALVSPEAESRHRFPVEAPRLLLERAARALPGLPAAPMEKDLLARVCIRPIPADGFPIVGALPGVEGVYVAVTHSGVTLGLLLADLLAQEIRSGTVPSLLEPYRPARFT
ncbi:MAG TPA: FAD-dependent oxidoreductase [Chthonomonadaceae bacterium]|nr:FAD-dependent oxidoreductase [Chthonomonadaceae bacterium]